MLFNHQVSVSCFLYLCFLCLSHIFSMLVLCLPNSEHSSKFSKLGQGIRATFRAESPTRGSPFRIKRFEQSKLWCLQLLCISQMPSLDKEIPLISSRKHVAQLFPDKCWYVTIYCVLRRLRYQQMSTSKVYWGWLNPDFESVLKFLKRSCVIMYYPTVQFESNDKCPKGGGGGVPRGPGRNCYYYLNVIKLVVSLLLVILIVLLLLLDVV